MKQTGILTLIINLILLLNPNLYSLDLQNKVERSKYKTVKTSLKNFRNKVRVLTVSNYDDTGRITFYKYEYLWDKIHDISEYRYIYNKNYISYIGYEHGIKVSEDKILLDENENFLEFNSVFHKDDKKYINRKYLYKDNKLVSRVYTNAAYKSEYYMENFYYENNNLIKEEHRGSDYKGSDKLFEYDSQNKLIKETWTYDNKITRAIHYNYNSKQYLCNKIYEIIDGDKVILGLVKYFYNQDGDLIKTLSYVQDEPEGETVYEYE